MLKFANHPAAGGCKLNKEIYDQLFACVNGNNTTKELWSSGVNRLDMAIAVAENEITTVSMETVKLFKVVFCLFLVFKIKLATSVQVQTKVQRYSYTRR